ncbi:hypothetical protein [Streptomyces ehimensis]|uniref:Uncharacterized protein n=1 Tax=Streptomyces ehimensis TaxID=68195 RepID=A0ABV9BDU4_9ACTN
MLSVAARAYANPQGIVAETVGPYSVQRPQAGLYMTRDERRSLKLMAGRGGAFTINPTPPGAGAPPGRPASWDLPWRYGQ